MLKLGTHMDNRWLYRVYRNQAAALIRPFISSFFFFSNFQTLKIFVILFSGTVRPRRLKLRPRKLKLGAHVENGWPYRIYRNQAASAYSSYLFLHFSFSPIFKH